MLQIFTGRRKGGRGFWFFGRTLSVIQKRSFRPSAFLFFWISFTTVNAVAEESPPSAQPLPAAPAPPAAPSTEPLPDPWTWKQTPSPVYDAPRPVGPNRLLELGFDAGLVRRASQSDSIKYELSRTIGVHARVDVFRWLGARISVRWEFMPVEFRQGALGLPPGTTYSEPDLNRVYIGASFEPTWHATSLLALWGGVGVGWGRTTAESLYTQGAEQVALPIRSAVFVEMPLSAGARYEVIKDWMVVNLSGHVGFLWGDQTGALLNPYSTPGKAGGLVTVQGFPEVGTSLGFLAGVGCLL
jgi:hypothetical protein